jgi:hypothetical protein
MTNKHEQVADPNGFDERTYGLEVCNESFATSNVVRTKTDDRARAARGAK